MELLGEAMTAEAGLIQQHPTDLDLKRDLEALALHLQQVRERFRKAGGRGNGVT